ncbi:MAG: 50S ribosomal protein L24 [Candidatus Levybacteria bacterium]|nr:50S ribosomal protein L24 [Candidatus Levybacteria bacterium]
MKLHKGDTVQVVLGKDKGKSGKITDVSEKGKTVTVDGMNLYKRHIKARSERQKSEIVTRVRPLPVANVALICPKCKKITRVGYKTINKEKVRVCRKCDATI